MVIRAPKGTRDILPPETVKWQYLEKLYFDVCKRFGYNEIRIPVFEHTELFQRGVGETTDIVNKEMYTFSDKKNRSITLRPEGTAGVVRSYIENGMSSLPSPVKLAYNITCYRYENVQKGRYREFHQFGAEAFGAETPDIDAELISLLYIYLNELGIKNVSLNINSIGCPVCRSEYNRKLKEYLAAQIDDMCTLCRERFDKNPMRIIDCKDKKCSKIITSAPKITDFICKDCREHFEYLQGILDDIGIKYVVNKSIVRGLDYYTKTVFEFVSDNVGTQGTICGGGRYDGLVEECGGTQVPGCGFAMGVERLLMEAEASNIALPEGDPPDVCILGVDEAADKFTNTIAFNLRENGINTARILSGKTLRGKMKAAGKTGALYLAVFGENEMKSGKVGIKNMSTGEQKDVVIDVLAQEIMDLKTEEKERRKK